MKKEKEPTLNLPNKESGMIVPEGYFETFEANLSAKLKEFPPMVPAKVTTWQRVRPYLYMAAMFCGIWLMMRLFADLSRTTGLSTDTEMALTDDEEVLDYIYYTTANTHAYFYFESDDSADLEWIDNNE